MTVYQIQSRRSQRHINIILLLFIPMQHTVPLFGYHDTSIIVIIQGQPLLLLFKSLDDHMMVNLLLFTILLLVLNGGYLCTTELLAKR